MSTTTPNAYPNATTLRFGMWFFMPLYFVAFAFAFAAANGANDALSTQDPSNNFIGT